MGESRKGTGGLDPLPPGKSQVVMCLLRNKGTSFPQEAIGHLSGPIASRGRSVRPSVIYVNG